MTSVLLIVARHAPERLASLRRSFAQSEALEIVLDRRQGQRRRAQRAVERESRRADRRALAIETDLSVQGWALVRRPGTRAAPP